MLFVTLVSCCLVLILFSTENVSNVKLLRLFLSFWKLRLILFSLSSKNTLDFGVMMGSGALHVMSVCSCVLKLKLWFWWCSLTYWFQPKNHPTGIVKVIFVLRTTTLLLESHIFACENTQFSPTRFPKTSILPLWLIELLTPTQFYIFIYF